MSMIPFFPSLRPQIANRIWFEINTPPNEDDVLRYEREHDSWKESIKNAASDIPPLGKVLTKPGPETDDEDGTYLELRSCIIWLKANDDSDDSDTHDDDDDTNDRAIPGQPEQSALYSPGDDMNQIQEDAAPITADTL